MTLTEVFTTNGLSAEQAQTVQDAMTKAGIYTASEANLDVRYKKLKDDSDKLKGDLEKYKAFETKATEAETKLSDLQKALDGEKLERAIDSAIYSAGGKDREYIAFKLKQSEGFSAEKLDEALKAFKEKHPEHFGEVKQVKTKVVENRLKTGSSGDGLSKEEILKLPYKARLELFAKDPDAYKKAMGNN